MTDTSFCITHANPFFIKTFTNGSTTLVGKFLYQIIGIENTEQFIAAKDNCIQFPTNKFTIETKFTTTQEH
jgi:hypothetical protein